MHQAQENQNDEFINEKQRRIFSAKVCVPTKSGLEIFRTSGLGKLGCIWL